MSLHFEMTLLRRLQCQWHFNLIHQTLLPYAHTLLAWERDEWHFPDQLHF